jgi:hypothetical protein
MHKAKHLPWEYGRRSETKGFGFRVGQHQEIYLALPEMREES